MDDPRLTPARPEVAAKYLEGKVKAARFVEGETFEVTQGISPVRRAPASDAEQLTEALRGERVTVYDRNGEGWAWGQLGSDGYVGWLPDSTLAKRLSKPTHKVTALWTFAFAGPSIKTPPTHSLPMGAAMEIAREDGSFAVIDGGYYVPRQHLGPLDAKAPDFVASFYEPGDSIGQMKHKGYGWKGASLLYVPVSDLRPAFDAIVFRRRESRISGETR